MSQSDRYRSSEGRSESCPFTPLCPPALSLPPWVSLPLFPPSARYNVFLSSSPRGGFKTPRTAPLPGERRFKSTHGYTPPHELGPHSTASTSAQYSKEQIGYCSPRLLCAAASCGTVRDLVRCCVTWHPAAR